MYSVCAHEVRKHIVQRRITTPGERQNTHIYIHGYYTRVVPHFVPNHRMGVHLIHMWRGDFTILGCSGWQYCFCINEDFPRCRDVRSQTSRAKKEERQNAWCTAFKWWTRAITHIIVFARMGLMNRYLADCLTCTNNTRIYYRLFIVAQKLIPISKLYGRRARRLLSRIGLFAFWVGLGSPAFVV